MAGYLVAFISARSHKAIAVWMLATLVGLYVTGVNQGKAEPLIDKGVVPHLAAKGQQGFLDFKSSPPSRAFAIASGGAWAWVSGYTSPRAAIGAAVAQCGEYTSMKCLPYAVDDEIIFDEKAWAASWGPYLSAAQAADASEGVMIGSRFANLELIAPDGRQVILSDLKGKVVFLHFWGSWCPPCQAEFPELQKLYDSLSSSHGIVFVMVQSREAISRSRSWAKRSGITMPLYDSGTQDRKDTEFRLAGGTKIGDRRLAPSFPSTYILDGNGIVVFAHAGRVSGWPGYEPMLRHVMKASGD